RGLRTPVGLRAKRTRRLRLAQRDRLGDPPILRTRLTGTTRHQRSPHMPIDPAAQKMLDDAKPSGRPNAHLLPVETARVNFENTYAALEKPPVHRAVDVDIPTRDGETIPGRLYLPTGDAVLPLTVYFHGGGWLLGSVDSHDHTARLLANASG